ncbi:fimbrial protein [Serratia oryzae]|nr:fimbrial protein [Serratia oryzae]
MMMKKSFTSRVITLASILAGLSTYATMASDGTLLFSSKLLGTACMITPSQNIVLDDMAIGQFPSPGATAALKEFEIELSNCPPQVKNAQIRFEGTASEYTAYRAFALDDQDAPTTAKGIAFQIQNDPKYNIYASIAPNTLSYKVELDTTPGNINKLIFTGRYVAVSNDIKAGTANVTTQFSIIYP